MITLSQEEDEVRNVLVDVAAGNLVTGYPGLISYKELWMQISTDKWGMGKTRKIVSIITKITAYELERDRPPLNELVVESKTKLPGEPWESIKKYHEETFGVIAPYSSHQEAQEACWSYWAESTKAQPIEYEVEEGYGQDRTAKFKKRNGKIVEQRKIQDNYTCQSCGFHLEVNGKFIIDCHHLYPVGLYDDVKITKLSDLKCLCPTCHRIAHTKKFPLTTKEIKMALKKRS